MDIFSSALHDTNHHNGLNDRRQKSRVHDEARNGHRDESDDHPNMHRESLFLYSHKLRFFFKYGIH